MFDFAQARRYMIEGQIRTNEITDTPIVAAMHAVPRELFVSGSWQTLAYSDHEIPAVEGSGRKLLNPMVLGKLLKAADLQPGERVLMIGGCTGYGAALASRIAAEVVALETPDLAAASTDALRKGGFTNVVVVAGDLAAGCADQPPFDAIIIEGAVEVIPDGLAAQLKPDGRLVAVLGSGRSGQGTVFRAVGGELSGFPVFGAAAPVLPGFEQKREFVF
jgi:protein-L-isoaspartate(D-aspartate) O-methyltransferase